LLLNVCFDVMLLCRPVVVPQDELGAPASLPLTISADLKVVGAVLADDAWTATPSQGAAESRAASPPVVDTRVVSPPRTVEVQEGATSGDIGATTSQRVIDVNPISARPAMAEDLVKDQPQIDQRQEVWEHLAHRYLNLLLRAHGYRTGRLTGTVPFGRMTSLKTTRI
jgi:hypothetical protein